jgi:hypothetical protein
LARRVTKNKHRFAITQGLAERVERIRMFGSAALDLAFVAEGRTDACEYLPTNHRTARQGFHLQRLRSLGTRIGRGVWCETHWLPEPDLISLAAGASVNRGCVLQTHLFHDRVMRLDQVRLEHGATLGPRTIVLPGSSIGAGATVGGGSLVMAAESVPGNGHWQGAPISRVQS